jgi:hypothetical protein
MGFAAGGSSRPQINALVIEQLAIKKAVTIQLPPFLISLSHAQSNEASIKAILRTGGLLFDRGACHLAGRFFHCHRK